MFEDASLDIACPQCGHKNVKTFAWIKRHSDFPCGGCRKTIHLDADQFRGSLKKIDDSAAKLRKTLSSFGKRR
jgi:transposase-like protein